MPTGRFSGNRLLTSPPSQVYKDGNHKPEMALALTPFEALCGFVHHAELVDALEATPELRGLVGEAMSSLVASTGDTFLRSAATSKQSIRL